MSSRRQRPNHSRRWVRGFLGLAVVAVLIAVLPSAAPAAPAPQTPSVTLSVDPLGSAPNWTPITLTATVSPAGATGRVTFDVGSAGGGARDLVDGVATLKVDPVMIPTGRITITASYGPDSAAGALGWLPTSASVDYYVAPPEPTTNVGLPSDPTSLFWLGVRKTGLYMDSGIGMWPTVVTVKRSKLNVHLPQTILRTWFLSCPIKAGAITGGTGPDGNRQCEGFPVKEFPSDPVNQFATIGYMWVQSPRGADQPYGIFPPVRVHTVAFGSIPVTATVNVRQYSHGGVVDPIPFSQSFEQDGTAPAGRIIPGYEEYGPSLGPTSVFVRGIQSHAPVEVRLSDISVDGVGLPVGPSCRASQARLDVTTATGWGEAAVLAGLRDPVKGAPDEFRVVGPAPSYLQGNIDIPAFTGCRNGADDLSRLITAMVSGSDNPLDITNSLPLLLRDPSGGRTWNQGFPHSGDSPKP